MENKYKITKVACYMTNVSMAMTSCMPPLLFLTFNKAYNISFTLLGLLAVACFGIQLFIDLVFTFFAKHFNLHLTLKTMPLFSAFGLLFYALMPLLFPQNAYAFLFVGTLMFSVSAGLAEVLISPLVAAIPSDNPEKEMSKLHAVYAWGVVAVVIISSILLQLLGGENWFLLPCIWSLLPIATFIAFSFAALPCISVGNGERGIKFPKGIFLLFLCIFLGGAAENSMTQWCSSFLEKSAGLPKTVGDVFGLALFALLLGLGRTLYGKFGKNILNTLLACMTSSFVCYVVAAISPSPIVSLIACVLTGFCVSMLWPGTLILMEEKYASVGVAAYALMAAGGDAGCSVGPQMVGAVTDAVLSFEGATELAQTFGLTADQMSMRVAILCASLFSLIGIFLLIGIKHFFKNKEKTR
ncbi:MAG: MFS transporter [Clostridia bacterium]|nr:MFS transporter [Clostridia bacterium]